MFILSFELDWCNYALIDPTNKNKIWNVFVSKNHRHASTDAFTLNVKYFIWMIWTKNNCDQTMIETTVHSSHFVHKKND